MLAKAMNGVDVATGIERIVVLPKRYEICLLLARIFKMFIGQHKFFSLAPSFSFESVI